MNQLALKIGDHEIINPTPQFKNLGDFITSLLNVVIYITAFVMVFWLFWGVFQYIFAGGEKEKLNKAKARITWAIVGFLIVVIALAISQFIQGIFPVGNKVTNITPP